MTTTTISTLDELEGLAVGEVITVGDNTNSWQKAAEGRWTRNGFVLDTDRFEGDVLQGRVVHGARLAMGQLWDDSPEPNYGYQYLIIQATGEAVGSSGMWWVMQLSGDGVFRRLVRLDVVPGRLVTEQPAWRDIAYTLGRQMVSLTSQVNSHREAYTAEQRRRIDMVAASELQMTTLREAIQTGLHSFIAEHEEARGPLGDLLAANGMRRPEEVVTVTIGATVSKYVVVPVDFLQSVVPAGSTVTQAAQVMASFDVALTTEVNVEGGACGCAAVTRGRVRRLLNENNMEDHYDFRYTRTCTGCTPAPSFD